MVRATFVPSTEYQAGEISGSHDSRPYINLIACELFLLFGHTGRYLLIWQVTEWLLLSVVFILILARLYLRLKIKRQRVTPSDWFLILAFLSAASALSFDIIFLRMGILRPDVDVYLTSVDDPALLQTAFRVRTTLVIFFVRERPMLTG